MLLLEKVFDPVTPGQFAQRLRELFHEKGVSGAEIARRSGFRQSSISEWLRGEKEPKATAVKKLAEALGVPVELLFADPTTDPGVPAKGRPRSKDPNKDDEGTSSEEKSS
ncbi:helix-turn-helix transcriptional regulator [Telmatocola sphagniphila]|uniref:Helix-turn-helix transcriptional regulator n=1 Tax=Telmatocola sphagniphila TaxID=1123043 RepID=A0A8E6B6Z9_9BACT|nr:helix-turn-helix transcriptional regulator [Telmatocola sphagniphila]QVL32316.1 helix-turn-helix transcriptional regulator [Telmatocola sphagniphila]